MSFRQQPRPIAVGDRVRFHRGKKNFTVRQIENDYITRTDLYVNPIHVLDVVRVGEKPPSPLRDKFGRTAGEAARDKFKTGKWAIYTILGDLWVLVSKIESNGTIYAKSRADDPETHKFTPHLYNGGWSWNRVGTPYDLRPDDGTFHEYSD